ncbi:MAG: hypothetical protein WCK47_13520 [bacterium]|nr:hypothetical protein [Candidatus Sumerlaeota bacterium]
MIRKFCCLLFCAMLALFCSCRLQPKGALVVRIGGQKEIHSAQLIPAEGSGRPLAIKLKFVDTNTFQISASLVPPGTYTFSGRAGEGLLLSRELVIEPGKFFYDLPELSNTLPKAPEGPRLSGAISTLHGVMPNEIFVMFIGWDIIMKRVPVVNGKFSVNAPAAGRCRIEIIAPGETPRSWMMKNADLRGPLELGLISLD